MSGLPDPTRLDFMESGEYARIVAQCADELRELHPKAAMTLDWRVRMFTHRHNELAELGR